MGGDGQEVKIVEPVLVVSVGQINFGKQYSEIYYQNHPDKKLKCRIRKLTPKECFRLMGFDDKDFDNAKNNGVSNSQLYKQAGNSIVVNVLMAIFSEIDFNLPKENNE